MKAPFFIENISEINPKTRYWFVRTEGGGLYDIYKDDNFIAIGWNQISINMLETLSFNNIADIYAKTLQETRSKKDISTTVNQLFRFYNIEKNDIVIIPSKNSTNYTFGIVQDERPYESYENDMCEYNKRRKVKWVKTVYVGNIDPHFYKIRNRHTITNVDYLSIYIDKVVEKLYRKGENIHLVFDIETKEAINVKILAELLTDIQSLVEDANAFYSFEEDVQSTSVRLNLQSPGQIECITKIGKSLAVVAGALAFASCGGINNNKSSSTIEDDTKKLSNFVRENEAKIRRIEENQKILNSNNNSDYQDVLFGK
ncbi:hypothetical protein [Edaphocola flava]|uniref:hypothetical protein n=1 Tax=Edaphocola flava TaxID=2499629 RepID=UPI00100ADD3F|nr:hypothetical protein [Edaphocola flava]